MYIEKNIVCLLFYTINDIFKKKYVIIFNIQVIQMHRLILLHC